MKNPLFLVALATALLACNFTAQDARAQRELGVRVIDLNYVFKNNRAFSVQRDQMKAKLDRAEAEVQALKQELQKLAQSVTDMPLGSPDRNRLEEEYAKRSADLSLRVQRDKKDFLREEARIYYNTYVGVQKEIQYYCEQNNVGLVLRFNGDEIDPASPQQVLQGVNKPILYASRKIDITPIIVEALDRRGGHFSNTGGNNNGETRLPPRGPQRVPPRRQ